MKKKNLLLIGLLVICLIVLYVLMNKTSLLDKELVDNDKVPEVITTIPGQDNHFAEGDKDPNSPPNPLEPSPTLSPEDIEKIEFAKELENMTAIELVALLGNGINLGHTMDAYGRATHGVNQPSSVYETSWGQPITTQEMITGMKTAGFDTLRIPVAWTNAIDYESGNYTINQEYLDRVGEIIDYALNADMFVVVNAHWDGGWWGMFGSETEATRKEAMKLYTSLWEQIATNYKDRSPKLLFESGNKELGYHLNDKDVCLNSGSLSEEECYITTNEINQAFVDIVRSTGGINENRFLIIAGSNATIKDTCDIRFQMPKDTANSKLLVSVQYYDPINYCLFSGAKSWGSQKELQTMLETLTLMNQFQNSGYGVVISEWGIVNMDVPDKTNQKDYMEFFLNICDYYNYCPILWDENKFFNKYDLSIREGYEDFFLLRNYESEKETEIEGLKAATKVKIDEMFIKSEEVPSMPKERPIAWLSYISEDWEVYYNRKDSYNPEDKTTGVIGNDIPIYDKGTYTVSLDFTKTPKKMAKGITSCAIYIENGDVYYPHYIIDLKEVKINGELVTIHDIPVTMVSENRTSTLLSLYGVLGLAEESTQRAVSDEVHNYTIEPITKDDFSSVRTIEVTFDYYPVSEVQNAEIFTNISEE